MPICALASSTRAAAMQQIVVVIQGLTGQLLERRIAGKAATRANRRGIQPWAGSGNRDGYPE